MAESSVSDALDRVQTYLLDIGVSIVEENEAEGIFVVEDEANGIKNLVVDCEPPIIVLEQLIMEAPAGEDFCRRLLQINRTLVHGAFVLDAEGRRVFFRDTLQLKNLDLNELEGSIRALSLAMAENANELLQIARG